MSLARVSKLLVAGALLALLPQSGLAQEPKTVGAYLAEGYALATVVAVAGGYGVVMTKGAEVVMCSIEIDAGGTAFTTRKCYPIK